MVNPDTKLLGLIGYPIGHSLSPVLHNSVFEEEEMNYIYNCYEIMPSNLKKGIEGIKALNIKGVNVTIPYKEKVIYYLDEIDKWAKTIGAVNTIVNNNGDLKGYNTDVKGFMKMLEQNDVCLKGKNVIIIGAGGVAKAIVACLANNNVKKVSIFNRTITKAQNIANYWNDKTHSIFKAYNLNKLFKVNSDFYVDLFNQTDILINCTPIGMKGYESRKLPVPEECINKNQVVIDLIYNPQYTYLLEIARKKGAKNINGMGMFINQALFSLEHWINNEIDKERLYDFLSNKLK